MIRYFFIFILLFFTNTSLAQSRSEPTPVIVTSVIRSNFADKVEALGTTRANETVIITADTSEKISEIHFNDGEEVRKGTLLVTLDKKQEEAELRASEALTAETQNAYDRASALKGKNALSRATLQQRATELRQSQAATEALEARLSNYEIRAPFDGMLGLREVSVGALVQPGDIITTIDDLSQIKVDFDVPSVFLASLQPGLPIIGHVEAFRSETFKGEVKTINTQIDPITRTVRVRAVIPNENRTLKPGLLMTIELLKDSRQALLIPEESLLKIGEKNFVFIVITEEKNLIAQQREITIGNRRPGIIEVLSGLKKGDKIVSHGTVKIRNGTKVSIRAVETEDTALDLLLKQPPQLKD